MKSIDWRTNYQYTINSINKTTVMRVSVDNTTYKTTFYAQGAYGMIFDCTLAAAHARMRYIQQTRQCLEAEHSARRHHGKEVGTYVRLSYSDCDARPVEQNTIHICCISTLSRLLTLLITKQLDHRPPAAIIN